MEFSGEGLIVHYPKRNGLDFGNNWSMCIIYRTPGFFIVTKHGAKCQSAVYLSNL